LTNPATMYKYSPNGNPWHFENNGMFFLLDTIKGYYHYTYVLDSVLHIADSTWAYEVDTNRVYIQDSTLVTKYDTTNPNYRNTWEMIDLPLNFGYTFSMGKWDIATKAGVIASKILYPSERNISMDGYNSEVAFKDVYPFRKFVFSGQASILFAYNMNPRWALWVEPYGRMSLTSITKSDSGISHKLRMTGLRAGIMVKL
jgi:hypothetical protein